MESLKYTFAAGFFLCEYTRRNACNVCDNSTIKKTQVDICVSNMAVDTILLKNKLYYDKEQIAK